MTDTIQNIYKMNTKLIGFMYKAVVHFRRSDYGKALSIIADSMEDIHIVTDSIIKDREYYNLVSTDSVIEMLAGIVEAQKNKDYILLADLIELQIITFLCNVQGLIMQKEEYPVFSKEEYDTAVGLLLVRIDNYQDACAGMLEELDPEKLLKLGYRIEFTTSGLMTLAVTDMDGFSYYMHSNHIITGEAYATAVNWYETDVERYIIFGFGMGYVVLEFLELVKGKGVSVTVYEQDIHILQLACGFSGLEALYENPDLHIVYDPELTLFQNAVLLEDAKVCVYYPALRLVKDMETKEVLIKYLPWADAV